VTARREFGGAILGCVLAAGLVLLGLHQHWGRVFYTAPAPLPSGSLPVSGQSLRPAVSALALAALACLAAVIATRGLARRAAGLVMAVLGAWITVVLGGPVSSASALAAATGQAGPAGLAGSVPGGNSAISGNSSGGSLPLIGTVSHVGWDGQAWRQAAIGGAVAVIVVGLVVMWRGQRWPVMSARFDRPGPPPGAAAGPGPAAASAPASPPEGDPAALWEALDRGEDLTESAAAPREDT
jgi:hypothetical protein